MSKKLALKSFRLKNFKAIRDSGKVEFTPLTVLIGDNGSGKSSLVEGLQTYQRIISHGLDEAMGKWLGFEHIANPPFARESDAFFSRHSVEPIDFHLRGRAATRAYGTKMRLSFDYEEGRALIESERLSIGNRTVLQRNHDGKVNTRDDKEQSITVDPEMSVIAPWIFVTDEAEDFGQSLFSQVSPLLTNFFNWQFVTLNPSVMGRPRRQHGRAGRVRLRDTGANIAEYLRDILLRDREAFYGIVETLQFVLPYLNDLQPKLTSELERAIYLTMTEDDFTVPGWLLSTGTMRILALLALFRHPNPPPLIVIEEIENGLDPRCIHLIVDEIKDLVESGRSQVIVTTHSPYFLDLLPLSSIVLVERKAGFPTFSRPGERDEVVEWLKRFSPGRLYTMEALSSSNA